MTEDTYREHLNNLQLEVEELRAKLKASQTGDLISRQAALAALTSTAGVGNRALNKIRELPSAQPDIVRCKDCKHYYADIFGSELNLPPMYDYIIVAHHGCKRWSQDENDMKGVKPDGYCFLAERREE